jgi:glycosyltransferase involved in cell wall biosynthesis
MMGRLADHNRVIYLDPPVSPLRLARRPRLMTSLLKGGQDLRDGQLLIRQAGLIFPFGYLPPFNLLNQKVVGARVMRLLRDCEIAEVILWFYAPYYFRLVDWVRPAVACYDCLDDLASLAHGRPALARRTAALEEELLRKVDVVFATTQALADAKGQVCARSYALPPGVDVKLYGSALDPSCSVPDELDPIPRPRLGFVGVVDWRLDWELLEGIARRRPDWSIVLVGPVERKPQSLACLGNVRFLGRRPVVDLPRYLRGFDVCLIPYAEGPFSESANPTKLREYLAAGRPVVSTPLPTLGDTGGVMRTARGVEEFELAVQRALEEDSPTLRRQRLEWARAFSWDSRVENAASILAQLAG